MSKTHIYCTVIIRIPAGIEMSCLYLDYSIYSYDKVCGLFAGVGQGILVKDGCGLG